MIRVISIYYNKKKDRFGRYFINAIVMEFCNGSSLATIIERPENFFGLQQDEYLIFLKHLSKGIFLKLCMSKGFIFQFKFTF
jgi:hypothetical protein